MIIGAIGVGEESCVIFNENTRDSRLCANDLEEIFLKGICNPSIESIVMDKLTGPDFSITPYRTSDCGFTGDANVIVQYVLHWKKPVVVDQ